MPLARKKERPLRPSARPLLPPSLGMNCSVDGTVSASKKRRLLALRDGEKWASAGLQRGGAWFDICRGLVCVWGLFCILDVTCRRGKGVAGVKWHLLMVPPFCFARVSRQT